MQDEIFTSNHIANHVKCKWSLKKMKQIVKSDLKTQSRKLQIYAVNNKPTLYIKTYIG